MYKDNKLCLIPDDVYKRQCKELDEYKQLGTLGEIMEATNKQNRIDKILSEERINGLR